MLAELFVVTQCQQRHKRVIFLIFVFLLIKNRGINLKHLVHANPLVRATHMRPTEHTNTGN